MKNFYTQNQQALQNFLILSGRILSFFLFFRYLFPIFLPFLLGWVLSLVFCPFTDFLEKHKIPRFLGSLISILLFLFGLGFLAYYGGSKLTQQMANFLDSLPHYLKIAQDTLTNFSNTINSLTIGLPNVITNVTTYVQEEFSAILLSIIQSSGSISAITALPKIFIGALISLFSAYFFTKDAALSKHIYCQHVQPLLGIHLKSTKKDLIFSLSGYVKTQLILMAFVFCLCLICFYFIGSPYGLLMSFSIAIIDALPFFGSGFILWPAAVIHILLGNFTLGVSYLVLYGVLQVLRQLIQPKILGSQIGMHPLLTLFSMYFGYACIGVWGLILGPVIAVVLRTILRIHQDTPMV